MKSTSYYAERIYNLAVTSPEVNSLDEDEVIEYARQKANELFLDEESIVEGVAAIQPSTADFEQASNVTRNIDRFRNQ